MSGVGGVTSARAAEPRFSTIEGRTWLTYPDLDDPGLLHGIVVFRELHPGTPHGQWTGAVRAYFARGTPLAGLPIFFCRQVHGARVGTVRPSDSTRESGRTLGSPKARPAARPFHVEPEGPGGMDALVTGERGVALAVTVADCLPLFGVCARQGTVGVAHCGWRGVAAGVVEEFLRALRAVGGDARFVVGAGIGPCCYEVRDDMLGAFGPDAGDYSRADRGRTTFDLRAAVAGRLARQGVSREDVLIDGTCTSCRKDLLSSYRARAGECGRMVAFVARAESQSRRVIWRRSGGDPEVIP